MSKCWCGILQMVIINCFRISLSACKSTSPICMKGERMWRAKRAQRAQRVEDMGVKGCEWWKGHEGRKGKKGVKSKKGAKGKKGVKGKKGPKGGRHGREGVWTMERAWRAKRVKRQEGCEEQKGCKGKKGCEGQKGQKTWVWRAQRAEGWKTRLLSCNHFWVQKDQTSSITTYSVEVSPPPSSTFTTPSTFSEWQMAFIGPHHRPKIMGQKDQTNH